MGGLFDALFLQWRVDDGRAEKEDQRAPTRVSVATQPEPLDRNIRVAPRDHNSRGAVRVVQPVWIESFRQTEIQKLWASSIK